MASLSSATARGTPSAPPSRRFTPWHSKDYRLLLFGTLAAVLGNWIQQIGQGWYVLQLTGSAFDLSLVQAASAFPMLLFGLLGGVIADRVDRTRLVTVTRASIAGLSILLGLLVWAGLAPLWVVVLIAGVTGIIWAFDMPARQAMVPQLVAPQARTAAIAWLATVMNAGRIVGPAIGGVLLGFVGAAGCIIVSGMGFLVMAGLSTRIRPLPAAPAAQRDLARELATGLRYLVGNRTILALVLLSAAIVVFWQAHVVLLPVFARDVLLAGASGYGLLSAASGVGALLGALLVAAWLPPRHHGWTLAGLAIASGVLLPLWASATGFVLSLALLLVATAFGVAAQTLAASLVQREVPDQLQGRVMSVTLLTWGASPLGLLLVGALADLSSAPVAVAVTSAVTLLISVLVIVGAPGVRRL
ncbi:MAG: MFS transporter [Chloroflexota bacterium]|nr:MFS transporter [Dehalococcoidia bacterium]MDW8254016.1 MFS transporter [Chloroflexota bacterium]